MFLNIKEKKMEFPTEKVIRVNGLKITVKPYLTTAVIDAILDIASEQTSHAVRCALADMMVMHNCTDLEDFADDEIGVDTYDVYKANGVIDAITREISGYDVLLSGLADLSVRDIYTRFEGAITEFTNEFKNIDLEGQQKKFEETLGELKQVEAEKEAILNG